MLQFDFNIICFLIKNILFEDFIQIYFAFYSILGIFTSLTTNFTSSNTEGIAFDGNVWEGILFSNFCSKKACFEEMLLMKICFIMQRN